MLDSYPRTKIHIGERSLQMSTNARNEDEFLTSFVVALQEADGDGHRLELPIMAVHRLASILPQVVDICCKLRGYKADVTEYRVIVAGERTPDDVVEMFSDYQATTK